MTFVDGNKYCRYYLFVNKMRANKEIEDTMMVFFMRPPRLIICSVRLI
jgi:hypothetical protein